MSEFLTMEEAAERLGVDYKTVYRLVRNGELPAGKIGRIYRIRKADLDGYFERQKQLVAEQGRRLTPVAGLTCGACGREILSELSVGGQCTECGREICQACWSIRKRRTCEAHDTAPAKGEAAGPAAVRSPGEEEAERAAKIAELREAGRPVITADEARLSEETFLRAFGQRLERIEELRDPLSGLTMRLRDVRVKHSVVEGARARRGQAANRISRFILRAGGWGKRKGCIVLEGRFTARPEVLREQGYDAEPMGKDELAPMLNELADKVGKGDCFHVVLMASPSGWTDEAAALVTDPHGAEAFRDGRAAVVLHDLHADRALLDEADERLHPFWSLVAPALERGAVAGCVETVRDLVARRGSVSLADAVQACGGTECWVRTAFSELGSAGEFVVDTLDEVGQVISRKKR